MISIILLLSVLLTMAAAENVPEQISLNYRASPAEMVAMWAVVVGTSSIDGAVCEFGTYQDNLV